MQQPKTIEEEIDRDILTVDTNQDDVLVAPVKSPYSDKQLEELLNG